MASAMVASAQGVVSYGYAPKEMSESDRIFQGQGANGFLAGLICLDPSVDPVVARLEGHQIKGVRCYMHSDYKQARQDRSYIMHTTHPDAEPTKKICDFVEGWNDIYFDEPITIGTDPIYVGMRVYELRGSSHPFASYGSASVEGACWINLNNEGWTNYTNRGTLLIEAILDDEAASKIDNMVYVQAATTPQTVAPSAPFECEVYFHNYTDEEVGSLEINTHGQGDTELRTTTVTFDTPLAAGEGRNLPMEVYAGSETGVSQWVEMSVSKINGQEAQAARPGRSYHYVTVDAFQRTSLVEVFTSQSCTNCPFMLYFLDKAVKEFDGELVYLSHHTGFVNDLFTQPGEESLLYLFSGGAAASFNPGVMYDRYLFPGEVDPVFGASVAETTPYEQAFDVVTVRLAMAEVNIDFEHDVTTDMLSCTVSGRINSELAAAGTPVYLSAYIVEDEIPATGFYQQEGLETDDPDAPADLIESFRHNGVKRHVYTEHLGTQLTLGSDNDFSVTFEDVEWDSDWVVENCRLVAFVHKYDNNDFANNEVLNASQKWLSGSSAVDGIDVDNERVQFVVTPHRTIQASAHVNSYRIYNLQGAFLSNNAHLAPGVYIVEYKTQAGTRGVSKVLVR